MPYSKYLGIPTHTNDGLYQDPDTGDIAYVKNGVAKWIFTEEGALTLASTLSVTGAVTASAGVLLGTAGTIKTVKKSLTATQLKSTDTLELVAAPGSGKLIVPVSICGKYTYLTTAFAEPSAPDDFVVYLKDNTGPALCTFDSTNWLTATADRWQFPILTAVQAHADTEVSNEALVMKQSGTALTDGLGSAAIYVTYVEVVI